MRWILIVLLGVHALIHLVGFATRFGYVVLPQLIQPISRPWGVAWLAAACLVMACAGLLAAGARNYWVAGALGLVVSQVVIVSAWQDAWAGTGVNAILLLVVVHGWLTEGPRSFHAQYLRDASAGLARAVAAPVVTEADLTRLPDPVRRYLRVTRSVGQPRVQNYRLRFRGRIRRARDSRWMSFEAEQQSFADEPARLFLMRARMFGVPVEAFHRSIGGHATMQVTVAGAFPIEDARGAEMDRAETVTLFNDMCLLAPATLIDRAIVWEPVDALTARAAFTHAGHTIRADLVFNDAGELTDFRSDDRLQSTGPSTMQPVRWSTPFGGYRTFGAYHLGSRGAAQWHEPTGTYAYIELAIDDIAFNLAYDLH